jgi:hypothetical protein
MTGPKLLLKCLLIFCLAIPIASCTKEWTLTIVSIDPEQPTLCFQARSGCDGRGVQFDTIVVTEVTSRGDPIDETWAIRGASESQAGYVIHKIRYGHAPPGWIEEIKAKPIKIGSYYSVNSRYYLTRMANNKYVVIPREKFLSK